MASRRLFVAISLPDSIRSELTRVQQSLRAALAPTRGSSRVRWTMPDHLHVTLVFLGNVATDRVGDLCQSLDAACRPFGPLELSMGAIGAFPHSRAPRILWAKVVDHNGRLLVLARALGSHVRPFVAHLDERPFSAHVTIARVNRLDRPSVRALVATAAGLESEPIAGWTAKQVNLFESRLSQGGSTHHHMASFPLAAGT